MKCKLYLIMLICLMLVISGMVFAEDAEIINENDEELIDDVFIEENGDLINEVNDIDYDHLLTGDTVDDSLGETDLEVTLGVEPENDVGFFK